MDSEDIPWQQRLEIFKKAFSLLSNSVGLVRSRELSELEKLGLIHEFEITHEKACSVLRDYFNFQGNKYITGPRDATKVAYKEGLIFNGEAWMDMIRSRNQSSHTYNEKVAEDIVEKIRVNYIYLFNDFQKTMEKLRSGKQGPLFD